MSTPEELAAAKAASDKAALDTANADKARKDAEAAALAYEPKDFSKLIEGSQFDPKELERIVSHYKGRGLKREALESILAHEVSEHKEDLAHEAEQKKQLESTQAKWDKELFDSPEFGGGNTEVHKQSTVLSDRAIQAVFGDEFSKFVADTGLNRLPKFRLGMLKLGKLMAEDKLKIGGGPPSGGADGEKRTDAQLMYKEDAR